MTGKITFNVLTFPWSCECCGSGEHWEITIPELGQTFSQNDQFGGKLSRQHDDLPDFVEYGVDPGYVIRAYEDRGFEVTVVGYEYVREHYDD